MKQENKIPDSAAYWRECFSSSRDRVIILPRSPLSMFIYWEWTALRTSLFKTGKLDATVKLKLLYADSNTLAVEYSKPWDTLKMYIQPPQAGRSYYALLEILNSTGAHQTTLTSNTIVIPSGMPASAAEGYIPSSGERMVFLPSSMEGK
ncbi:MAG: DUF4912 domain-containing protein [Elusimicrobiaceae bacterium]